jgi:hypothetical protein
VDAAETQAAYLIQLDTAIENAIEDGASQEQLNLLESTRDDGYLSPSTMHEALMNYASCVGEHGLEFQEVGTSGPPEFPWFDAITGVANADEQEWMDRCDSMELSEVNGLYQTQPGYVQARKDIISTHREEILACLDSAGRPLSADATVEEITHEVFYAQFGRYIDAPREPAADFEPVDCISLTGFTFNDLEFDTRSPEFG